MKAQTIILILATLSTGLMAGIFFTWSNAVTTGIGRLADIDYLRAFQAMNRSILNPAFFAVLFGPALLLPFLSFLSFKSQPSVIFWLVLAAMLLYMVGVIGITLAGNVPLNTILDKTALDSISLDDAKSLRNTFENKWNSLNWIRSYSAIAAFITLLLSCIYTNT